MGQGSATASRSKVDANQGSSTQPHAARAADNYEETSTRPALTRSLSRISTTTPVQYRVYKRRFFGLVQLVLLNIVVSWDWITFAPISGTASRYFNTTESVINWLSTAFLFAFVIATPFTFYALAKHGPKTSIVIASCLLLVGNWVKYGGTKANTYPVVMVGQLLIGFAQPFVLSAPTTYSNVWFSAAGRTSATAVASLANPLGAALGQLISPFWATSPDKIPNTVLYTSIIASLACIPSFFIPAKPPTPPSASINAISTSSSRSTMTDLKILFRSPEFYLICIPFSVLVGFFNSFSSLLNQILSPYAFTEDDAGIAGALLIFVGLASAAVSSPLIDKYKFYLWYIRITVPIISFMYFVFVWAPSSRELAYVYVVCAVVGAASFGLVPVVLEFLVEVHYPLGPEVGSTICWCGGQLLGGIFIIVMDKLKGNGSGAESGNPPGNMRRALIFEAVVAMAVMPLPLCLGLFGRRDRIRMRRWESDKVDAGSPEVIQDEEEQGLTGEGS